MITLLDKKTLRKIALNKRTLILDDALNDAILKRIINFDVFKKAKNIALYFPIKNEIDITPIINIKEKNFYFPRCSNENLEFVQYQNKECLKIGKYNILEPMGEKINPNVLDIIFIPALMANRRFYRLGYGKGYYDRFFRKNNIQAKKIIIVPSELIVEEFIEDDFDIQCDAILSEKEIIC